MSLFFSLSRFNFFTIICTAPTKACVNTLISLIVNIIFSPSTSLFRATLSSLALSSTSILAGKGLPCLMHVLHSNALLAKYFPPLAFLVAIGVLWSLSPTPNITSPPSNSTPASASIFPLPLTIGLLCNLLLRLNGPNTSPSPFPFRFGTIVIVTLSLNLMSESTLAFSFHPSPFVSYCGGTRQAKYHHSTLTSVGRQQRSG